VWHHWCIIRCVVVHAAQKEALSTKACPRQLHGPRSEGMRARLRIDSRNHAPPQLLQREVAHEAGRTRLSVASEGAWIVGDGGGEAHGLMQRAGRSTRRQ